VSILAIIAGIALIVVVLADAFETVVFPRRVTRRIRLVRLFYRTTWRLWTALVHALSSGKRQENYLSYYGPLSLPLLLGFWASVLISGFALLYWAPGNALKTPEGFVTFGTCLYFSGTTFFTLGLGDIVPHTPIARALIVLESGMGFGFLAIVISYLPALNQSFSKREVNISLLDARAGSPPTAIEMVRRQSQDSATESLTRLLYEWERWSAELLESHLSFPVLVYFRSQHDNQSWLAALTSILDTCAFVMTNLQGTCVRQAQLTFAMARHAIVDLALVLHVAPEEPLIDRLPPRELASMYAALETEGVQLRKDADVAPRLYELRRMYEPYVHSLSLRLKLSVPPWVPEASRTDNWQITAWGEFIGMKRTERTGKNREGHF
jgi:ion channel